MSSISYDLIFKEGDPLIFDTHTDILYNIVAKRLKGKRGIVEDYHIPEQLEGNITGGIWTYFTDVEHLLCDDFDKAIGYILEEVEQSPDVQIVKSQDDWADHKVNVILGLESLAPIQDLNHLKKIYDLGFRHAMLTWNEVNHFGCGAFADSDTGLTDLGCQAVKLMNELGMVVDVSHASIKTMTDILDVTTEPVIASHSNCYALRGHRRNLTDGQIRGIAETGGVSGVTAVPDFVHSDEYTIKAMVDHIDYIKKLVGSKYIALGFDFMNYLSEDGVNANLSDCGSAKEAQLIIDELMSRGYSSMEIDDITHVNAKKVINRILKQ